MINLTKHSVNGKISVKSLVKTFDEYQAKEKELANKMFHLRGVFPRPEEYIELRNEMAQVKTTLSDLRNCLKIYCRYGNINGVFFVLFSPFLPSYFRRKDLNNGNDSAKNCSSGNGR